MRTLNAYKAQRITKDDPVISLTLVIDEEIPELETLDESSRLYQEQGVRIASALHAALPGGTFDQVLAAMFQLKASMLAVSHGDVSGRA